MKQGARGIQEIVNLARKGDRLAFDELVGPLLPRLEAQVRARMGPGVRAQVEPKDIVQETVLKAYGSIGGLEWRGEESFYRWLASIAEHLIWKTAQRSSCATLSLEDEPADDASPASSTITREERARRLEKALRGLSPDHLQVVVLTRLEGLRIGEVASRIGRSPNAVKKLLARALEELRHRFGDTSGSLRLPERPLEIGGALEIGGHLEIGEPRRGE